MQKLYEFTRFPLCQGWAVAILRVATGIVFFAHGYKKVFVDGLDGFAGFLSQIGIPAAGFFAPLVAIVELAGGLALITGLLTRWAAIPLAIDMLIAGVTVHLKNGFFLPNGYEYTFILLAASVSLFLAGSGDCALDNILFRGRKAAASANAPAA
jgi:putative oxidoreductase